MHTKDFLAQELIKAGLGELARKAALGHYHDFLSQEDFPSLVLEKDLRDVGTPEAEALRQRHLNGEFDATYEESTAWAESYEGKAAMQELIKKGN